MKIDNNKLAHYLNNFLATEDKQDSAASDTIDHKKHTSHTCTSQYSSQNMIQQKLINQLQALHHPGIAIEQLKTAFIRQALILKIGADRLNETLLDETVEAVATAFNQNKELAKQLESTLTKLLT
ncbi:hypothetical protein [Spartinivicinus ruber]|uniref:hypothetical protein n=1 Tax=Spartinivicinus ruber TaxID=2683272 RepID=UPI0013D64594|nr:hypothetical protein [Spartinivicinus ruber]